MSEAITDPPQAKEKMRFVTINFPLAVGNNLKDTAKKRGVSATKLASKLMEKALRRLNAGEIAIAPTIDEVPVAQEVKL